MAMGIFKFESQLVWNQMQSNPNSFSGNWKASVKKPLIFVLIWRYLIEASIAYMWEFTFSAEGFNHDGAALWGKPGQKAHDDLRRGPW